MDVKVSQKAEMLQPQGMIDVLVSGINDFYLIEETDTNGQRWIKDIEIIDDFPEEEKDRAVFAAIRQKGQDPIAPDEGVQWAEVLLGEAPVMLLMQQIIDAVSNETKYVNVNFETIIVNGQEQLVVRFNVIT